MASLLLAPALLASAPRRAELRKLGPTDWFRLALLGVVFYSLTQGAQFVALAFLPAVTLWLAIVNTAVAFTLWNRTLRNLTAIESTLINNTMLVQIAVLAWIFLGEPINAGEGVGLTLAVLGVVLVQLAGADKKNEPPVDERKVL